MNIQTTENNVKYDANLEESSAAKRIYLQQNSALAASQNKEKESIFYDTEALSLGFQHKYGIRFESETPKLENVFETFHKIGSKISTNKFNPKSGISKIKKICAEFPKEWTVIQLSKVFSPYLLSSKHQDNMNRNTAINITLFCYQNWEINDKNPIQIVLKAPEDNLFESTAALADTIKSYLPLKEGKVFVMDNAETIIQDVITKLKHWLGPWNCLFLGKFKYARARDIENTILDEVTNFCARFNFSKKQIALISLIGRSIDILEHEQIYEAATQIVEADTQQMEALFRFLMDLQMRPISKEQVDCYPCVLILDEMLDHFPWEMVNTNQETCRINSLITLSNIFHFYEKDIENGYLNVNAQHGHVVINPDETLPKMMKRLGVFYEYWLPDWKCTIGRVPTSEEFAETFSKMNVFVYNGHGNGLQFISGDCITENNIKCVTFLFGCDSVRLMSNGLHSEMLGSHMYYNAAALCPAVVGSLWVLTDFFTDEYSRNLVGTWVPSTNKHSNQHFSEIDNIAWKSGELVFNKKPITKPAANNNLLSIMANERSKSSYILRIRSAFVLRGIPVINSSFS